VKQHRLYGLSDEEYDRLLARANGQCEMCGEARRLTIDHCHSTHRVRGLVCSPCNTSVMHHERGQRLRDDVAQYLQACPPMLGDGRYRATPVTNFRCPDDIWQAAKAQARRDGTTVSAYVVFALEFFIDFGTVPSRDDWECWLIDHGKVA
jgi:hypothetical protein